ncbi:MAG TPA: hypothetical protein ENN97_06200 [Phycisphaerales bacterium]|nr:hypothetical protein [Phycisphaerales bacterium]
MISALLIGVVGIESEKSVSYTIDQFIDVQGPESFVSRLRDYTGPTQVRFVVRIAGLEAPEDPNAVQIAQQFLLERLSNAQMIKLRNVQDHGYFRLTAEVYADGLNVGRHMLKAGLMRPTPSKLDADTEDEAANGLGRFPEFPPSAEHFLSRPPSAAARGPDRPKRYAGQVDMSLIRPDTTFREALAIISGQEPRLPILVLWNDLERNAFVERDTPVGIEGVGRMRAEAALNLVLRAVATSGMRLRVISEGGVLTIATEVADLGKPTTRVYPVADLLARSSELYW